MTFKMPLITVRIFCGDAYESCGEFAVSCGELYELFVGVNRYVSVVYIVSAVRWRVERVFFI